MSNHDTPSSRGDTKGGLATSEEAKGLDATKSLPPRGLVVAEHKDGYTHFYWNGHDVTGHWMWFFSGLRPKEEKYASWIYAKRHGKELNKEFPL